MIHWNGGITMRARRVVSVSVALQLAIMPIPIVAQARDGMRVGLRDASTARVPIVAHIADPSQAHGNWKVGAFVGGLIGLALESLYHSAVTDDQHAEREAVELTLVGAVIGGLIAAH